MASELPVVAFLPGEGRLRVEVQRLDGSHPVVGMGRHAHRFLELVLFDRAGGEHEVAGVRRRVRRGDLWALAPGEPHDCTELGRAEGWLVLFCGEAVDPGAPSAPWRGDARWGAFMRPGASRAMRHLELGTHDRRRWEHDLEGLDSELQRPGPGHAVAVAARLNLLLLSAARLSVEQRGVTASGGTGADPLVNAVFAEIEQNFRAALPLRWIGRAVGRSPAHVSEVMRQRTGMTVGQWIIERRLAEARQELAASDAPLSEVAEHVGYLDVTHFSRQFKRAYGQTPGAWRRAHRLPVDPPIVPDNLL